MCAFDNRSDSRTLTERRVSAALGLEPLELLLVASELHLGRYDPLTHLSVFTPNEVERIAARLGIPWAEVARRLARQKPEELDEATLKGLPEPERE